MNPPVALFCYNRAAHLKACLERIECSQQHLSEPLPLYIFCDGAKTDGDLAVQETREVARAHPGAIVVERERNFGFRNITEGISQLCNQFGRAIIIEDDILIAPDFLPYMCKALDRYENDERVWVVSGFMYYGTQPAKPELFFQPYSFIWGWATWKRAWDHFEWEPKGWKEHLQNRKNRHRFDCFNSIKFSKMLEKSVTGVWNTWDCQWGFSVYRHGGLTLSPYRSLIWNCGCGGGTHGDFSKNRAIELGDREHYIHGDMTLEDFKKPRLSPSFSFPEHVACDERVMRHLAVGFLQERLRTHRNKRIRTYLKIWINRIAALLTPRPQKSRVTD